MNKIPDLLSRQVVKLTITELSPENLAEEQKADPHFAERFAVISRGETYQQRHFLFLLLTLS